jgi:REP element-mobilizing transposase RayT
MEKYKNKYKTTTNRLNIWDYSNIAYYFITICTNNRINYFGDIQNENIKLSRTGELVSINWNEIPNKFKNIEIDEFVIMPNHIHGIIFIKEEFDDNNDENVNNTKNKDTINRVSTNSYIIFKEHNPMFKKSLSTIIRWFKGKSSYEIRKNLNIPEFAWQRNYYDHIIRNEKELEEIRKYIYYNPLNWSNDEYNNIY